MYLARLQASQCFVRLGQGITIDRCTHGDGRCEVQEFDRIAPREVRDAPKAPFPPKHLVGKLRHPVQVNSVDRHGPSPVYGLQRGDHNITDRRKGDRSIERRGRQLIVCPCPHCPQRPGSLLLFHGAGADEHLAAPVHCYLDRTERRSAEAVKTKPPARLYARDTECTVPNHPATEQWRGIDRFEPSREPEREVGPHRDSLGKAAITVPAGERRLLAEVFPTSPAAGTCPTRTGEPRHPCPVANTPAGHPRAHRLDDAYSLVTGDQRQPMRLEIPFRELKVGTADTACLDPEHKLTRAGFRIREPRKPERTAGNRTGPFEKGSLHGGILTRNRAATVQPLGEASQQAKAFSMPLAREAAGARNNPQFGRTQGLGLTAPGTAGDISCR